MKTRLLAFFVALIACGASAGPTLASPDEQMSALKKQFEQRFPELARLKSDGVVGESADGFVEFVKDPDSSAAKLVEQENSDRRELYRLIAEKEQTTSQLVAQRNGARNFQRARPGEFLKGKDGEWFQKK
ncbi:MAG: YdbL family protein [Tepidisphaeraceae bacterium]